MPSEKGKFCDSRKGETLPNGVEPMPLLTDEELEHSPGPVPQAVVGDYVCRFWDRTTPAVSGDAAPYQVVATDDLPGATWTNAA